MYTRPIWRPRATSALIPAQLELSLYARHSDTAEEGCTIPISSDTINTDAHYNVSTCSIFQDLIHMHSLAKRTLAAKSAAPLFLPTYGGAIFDFFLNCSYTTYDVEYTIINGTTQSDFSFKPTLNGSVAEE
jgi:hypothetical protein